MKIYILDIETTWNPGLEKDDGFHPRHKKGSRGAKSKPVKPIRGGTFGGEDIGDVICCYGTLEYDGEHHDLVQDAGDNESDLLDGLLKFFLTQFAKEQAVCRLITFYGNQFDQPFIIDRLLKNGITGKPIRRLIGLLNRQSTMDLKYAVTTYFSCMFGQYPSLEKTCKFFFLDNYVDAHDEEDKILTADDVERLYEAKNWDMLMRYNKADLINTLGLYMEFDRLGLIPHNFSVQWSRDQTTVPNSTV